MFVRNWVGEPLYKVGIGIDKDCNPFFSLAVCLSHFKKIWSITSGRDVCLSLLAKHTIIPDVLPPHFIPIWVEMIDKCLPVNVVDSCTLHFRYFPFYELYWILWSFHHEAAEKAFKQLWNAMLCQIHLCFFFCCWHHKWLKKTVACRQDSAKGFKTQTIGNNGWIVDNLQNLSW